MAINDTRNDPNILQDIELTVLHNNDGCHLDAVMRTFINYYVDYKGLLGVLGPPCSETVEPVASKAFVSICIVYVRSSARGIECVCLSLNQLWNYLSLSSSRPVAG